MLKIMNLLLLFANLLNCSMQKKTESSLYLAEVLVKKDGEKLMGQFIFYHPIGEILNEKEHQYVGKSPLVVNFPAINDGLMKEMQDAGVQKMYLADIETFEKEHTITFMRKDGEYQGVVHINESDLGKTITVNFTKSGK